MSVVVKKFQSKFGQIFCETHFVDPIGVVTVYRDTTTSDTAIIIIEDVSNCRTIRGSTKTDVVKISGMDSTGSYDRVIGPDGNSIQETTLPDDCSILRTSSKSVVGGFERWDSTGYTVGAIDTSGKVIEQTFDLENCKITYSTSTTDNNLMLKIDSNGISTIAMDSSGNAIFEDADPTGCKVTRSSSKTPVNSVEEFGLTGHTRTVEIDTFFVTERNNPETGESCLTSNNGCVERKIEGNLTVTKQINSPTITTNLLFVDGTKSFRIDHPLDPDNKYLVHSCIEGPERINLYNGTIVTDQKGYFKVQMPDYFMSLNRDFEYNLTVIGKTFARAVVWEEMSEEGAFVIRTDEANVKVSWQVTGIRKDRKALETPFQTEILKSEFAEVFGEE